jgi:acyl carrier protein
MLLEIWAELLHSDAISPDDNFFLLGGDSLSAVRVISRIKKRLNVEVSISEFFSDPTPSGLASRLEAAREG